MAYGNFNLTHLGPTSTAVFTPPSHTSIIARDGSEILRISYNGCVTWVDVDKYDDAARIFTDMIQLSVERSAGITDAWAASIETEIYTGLVQLAELKGPLTLADLTNDLDQRKLIKTLANK